MKILVGIKRVIDASIRVRVNADQSGIVTDGVPMAINPFCEIALEEALRLKEQGFADEVIAVSIGPEAVQEQLRHCLALGADRVLHINTATSPEPLNIARLLQAVVNIETPGLILLGKQSIDTDNNQVGQMLAALCDYPQGTFASAVSIMDKRVTVRRETDNGEQTLSLSLPAVITADLRLNSPRYARLPDIMKARRQSVQQLTPEALGVSLKQHTRLLKLSEAPPRKPGIRVGSVHELLDRLSQAGLL